MATDIYGIWERYNKSKSYMDKKNILVKTEKQWQMYAGKQWAAVEDSQGMENLPMLNFIKPTVDYKVSNIAQHSVTALFSDMGNGKETVQVPNGIDPMTGSPMTRDVSLSEVVEIHAQYARMAHERCVAAIAEYATWRNVVKVLTLVLSCLVVIVDGSQVASLRQVSAAMYILINFEQ
jgi:hypothetical protein